MNRVAERAKSLLFEPGQTLSQRVVRGGIWVFALRIADRLFKLIRTIVLARVLAPGDFGLMGIALLAMSALETFSQTGFQAALIQKKEDIKDYLDTAWTVSALRGFVLFAVLYLAAPYIALFFDTPAATSIMRVIGISMLLNGLTNIGVVYFQKELEFNKQFVYQLSGTLADLIVAIMAALLLQSVWALVFGLLAGNLVRFVMSYLVHSYRPRVRFEAGRTKELYSFGRWVLRSSVLGFLVTQGDDIFVGKLLGAVGLGFYQIAYRISNMPATEITHVISQVTFPAYSKLQDKLPKLGEAYLKVLQLSSFISIPLAGGIFILAPEFTKIFLGEKWMPTVPAMQALVLAGLIRSIAATTGPIFRAVGEPQIETKWQIVRFLVLTILIYPLTVRWGILGTSMAVFLSILVSTIGFSFSAIKITKCGIENYSKKIALPLVNGIIMVSLIFALKTNVNTIGIGEFLLFVAIGVFCYAGITCLFDRFLNYGMRSIVKSVFTS